MCGLMLNMWVEMRIIVIFGNLFGLFGFLMELIKVRFIVFRVVKIIIWWKDLCYLMRMMRWK